METLTVSIDRLCPGFEFMKFALTDAEFGGRQQVSYCHFIRNVEDVFSNHNLERDSNGMSIDSRELVHRCVKHFDEDPARCGDGHPDRVRLTDKRVSLSDCRSFAYSPPLWVYVSNRATEFAKIASSSSGEMPDTTSLTP
jgi:hypothetical protein